MVNTFDKFQQEVQDNTIGDYTFVDADTIRDKDNKTYRLQGYDAPEIAGFKGKPDEEGDYTIDQWKQATAGSYEGTRAITNLIRNGGYDNIVKTGEFDPNGREIIRLTNNKGEDFTREIFRSGVLQPGKYATQQQLDAIKVADLFRDENFDETLWGQTAKTVAEAIRADSGKDLRFKEAAINELLYNPAVNTSAVKFRNYDRTIEGDSTNPFSDAWSQGWVSARESAYGFLNLLGETAGSEWAADVGEAGVERANTRLQEKGRLLLDYKDVDGFGTALEYVSNNFAISLPYLIGIAGASTAGALVGGVAGAGIAIGAPATIYAGQTWNEMEGEKDAAIALTSGVVQASLDRLGVSYILGAGFKGKGTKEILNKAVDELVKKGATREAAEQQVANATRKELAGFFNDAGKTASSQITSKEITKNFIKNLAATGAVEGVTEGLQEATGYIAATTGSDKVFDFNELRERVTAGAIAGSTIGGGLSIPASTFHTAAWVDAVHGLNPVTARDTSFANQLAEEERAENQGILPSIDQKIADTKIRQQQVPIKNTLDERSNRNKARRAGQTLTEEAIERGGNLSALWQGHVRNLFSNDILKRSGAARTLSQLFGGTLQKIYTGASYENAKHHLVSYYKNLVDLPENVLATLNDGKRLSKNARLEVNQRAYNTINNAIGKDGKLNPDLIPEGRHKQVYINLYNQVSQLSDKLWTDQHVYNKNLGYINNYLFKYKSIDSSAVKNNQDGFIKALKDKFNFSHDDARKITDQIIDNPEVNDIDEAFSLTRGQFKPSAHKQRSLGLSEHKEFQEFVEQDLFANISNASKSAARYVAHQKYIGDDASIISKLLDEMEEQGVAREEVDKIATGIRNYLDAESGNYNRPTTEAGKRLVALQKNFMLLSTFAGLPLAVVSSFVEIALSSQGLTLNQITGKEGSLRAVGKEGGKMIVNAIQDITDAAQNKAVTKKIELGTEGKSVGQLGFGQGKAILKELGYYSWDVGAATTTGVSEVGKEHQRYLDNFFKWTGLQGWTNYTRAIRASIGMDYISDKLSLIDNYSGNVDSRDVAQAKEALLNLGIDYDRLGIIRKKINANLPLTENEQVFEDATMREAIFNFVNNAVALPQTANRPLIYQDPRFALFTQFQGFIATFTANHIPKLWGEYVKRGTPAMKYNAFATMATMIMLGYASQEIKDRLKYFGENPYLEPHEKARRAVYASGLLGAGERIIDLAYPLYGDNRNQGSVDWLFNTAKSESPALSNINRIVGASGKVLTGDVQGGIQQGLKVAPWLGPWNQANEWISQALTGNWDFK